MDPNTDLRLIAEASLAAVDPYAMIKRSVRIDGAFLRIHAPESQFVFDLTLYPRIFVLGFGKAAGPMARAIEEVLGPRIDKGVIAVKPGHQMELRRIRQVAGGHPVPDENSVRAAAEIAALADEADEHTLVIVLISGGGSSLMAAPARHAGHAVTLADIQETTRQLLACGATIAEINCIRKHLLMLAGGRLADRMFPAASVSFMLSDVVGNDMETIASGPACADSSTYNDSLSIIEYYGIGRALPEPVMDQLSAGASGEIPETPKPGSPGVSKARHVMLGTNLHALNAAREEAERLGYHTVILTSHIAGEAREVARVLAAMAKDAGVFGCAHEKPVCLLAGGETTVTLRGRGRGGRNQEMALAFLWEMEKDPKSLSRAQFLAFSTDGEDGPTDAAGGFASMPMVEKARSERLKISEYLRDNDSYSLLKKLDGLFVTGPTNTNVCDIQILLVPR